MKTVFRPLLMIMGEYEFASTFDNFKDNVPSLIYASIMLLSIGKQGYTVS